MTKKLKQFKKASVKALHKKIDALWKDSPVKTGACDELMEYCRRSDRSLT